MQYDAIILAGGQGSRLGGVDKARLLLAGTELVRRPLAAVRDAARVVVVGPPSLAADGVLPDGVLLTREDPPGGGPAAATTAGLDLLADISRDGRLSHDGHYWHDVGSSRGVQASPAGTRPMSPWVVLLSCDLPLAEAGIPHLLTAVQRPSTTPHPDTPRSSTVPHAETTRSSTAAKQRGDAAGQECPQPTTPLPDAAGTPPVPDTTTRSSTAAKQRGDAAGQECPQPTPLPEQPDGYCLTGPDGHLQWLFAIYRTSALLRAVRDCPEPAGTSMRRLLAPLTLVGIPGTAEVSADLDTWDDHATWTERLREDT